MQGLASGLPKRLQYQEKLHLYLAAGQKGSDVSAREATRRLVSATKQAHALQRMLGSIHAEANGQASTQSKSTEEQAKATAAAAGPWAAKNTIVRDVLNELTNATRAPRQTRSKVSKQDVAKRTTPRKQLHQHQ